MCDGNARSGRVNPERWRRPAGARLGPLGKDPPWPQKLYDAIIIGAGQAGPPLAVRCATQGLSTALIEREHLGGTCVNIGCIPTKTWWRARAPRTSRAEPPNSASSSTRPCRSTWRREGAQGPHRHAVALGASSSGCACHRRPDIDPRPRPLHRAATHRYRRPRADGAAIFINVGARSRTPRDSTGSTASPRSTTVSIMELDCAARTPRHRRRQLHRAGVRADVPPLRRASDRLSKWAPRLIAARRRGRVAIDPRDPARRRHRRARRRELPAVQPREKGRILVETSARAANPIVEGSAPAARRRTRTEHGRPRPGRRRHPDRRARPDRRRRPARTNVPRRLGAR